MNNLKRDLQIDTKNLDIEWATIAELYFKYSEQLDLADINLRKIKMKIDIRESELYKIVKKKNDMFCEKFKTKTLTETLIKSIITEDKTLQDLNEEMINIEEQKRMLSSICRSIEMKRDGLKNLVEMYKVGYFTVPKTDEEGAKLIKTQKEISNRDVREEIKNRLNVLTGTMPK